MKIRAALLAVIALAAMVPAHAQEKISYKLEVNIHDGADEAARVGRRYTFLLSPGQKGSFRVGTRTPTVTGALQVSPSGSTTSTQYAYVDVGVAIDCHIAEVGSRLSLHGSLELSSLNAAATYAANNPIVNQTKIDLEAILEQNKPIEVASIDDPATSRKLSVQVTITKAN